MWGVPVPPECQPMKMEAGRLAVTTFTNFTQVTANQNGRSKVVVMNPRKYEEGEKVFVDDYLSGTVVIPAKNKKEALSKEYSLVLEILIKLSAKKETRKGEILEVLKNAIEAASLPELVIPIPHIVEAIKRDSEARQIVSSAMTETEILELAFKALRTTYVQGLRVPQEELEYFFVIAALNPKKLAQAIAIEIDLTR